MEIRLDGKRAFVSSANFTTRAQDRNIEAGVLLHDATFAGSAGAAVAELDRRWLGACAVAQLDCGKLFVA